MVDGGQSLGDNQSEHQIKETGINIFNNSFNSGLIVVYDA